MNSAEYKHIRAVMNGKNNRELGAEWEKIISMSCDYYRRKGIAEIEKTPECSKVIQSLGNGRFISVFAKAAQPDYKGTLKGGRAVCFEAKFTDKGKLSQSVVTKAQSERLDSHEKLGAECFVLVSFSFKDFFKIPWSVFRSMKDHYGRKYITPDDVRRFEVKCSGCVIRFLK